MTAKPAQLIAPRRGRPALPLILLLSLTPAGGQEIDPEPLPRLLPPVVQELPAPAFASPPVAPSPVAPPPVAPGTAPPPPEAVAAPAGAATSVLGPPAAAGDTPVVAEGDDAPLPTPPVEYVWYQPAYWFGPTPWDTALELGVNGSSGTSNSFSIRTGGNLERETDRRKLALSLYYNNTKADGLTTQSNALFNGRRDWLFSDDSPWSLFALSQVFYDEFQAFDLNVNLNGGLGYDLIKREAMSLATSFGAGASREFGAPDEEWTPEAQFGLNYEQKVYGAHKVYAKVDYFPEWEDFNSYRVLSDFGLEIELSRPSNVSLKLSATDRYDSSPNGVPPHNTNYSVLLLWKL